MIEVSTLILLLLVASAAVVVAALVHVSYTLVLLVLGLVLGAADLLPDVTPSSEVILLVFLPPLIFQAAFEMDMPTLWSVRTGVLMFALPGVLLAAAVGGALVHWGFGMPWTLALLFGALISATDPVSVLATFKSLGVSERLRVLVEGESLLNDGTALVLLVTLTTAATGVITAPEAVLDFAVAVVGGIVIGVVIGWVAHFIIATVDQHLTEMAVSVGVAYGAFLAADSLEVSGVLATIAAAMVLGWLGRSRGWVFSERSHDVLADLWDFLAFVANACLFLLIGLEVSVAGLREQPSAVVWGVVAALVGRAVVAYGGGFALRWLRFPVSLPERHVLFWGGLRGAVALAGVLSLPSDFPRRDELLAMTYGAVLFTLIAQGITIGPLVRRLGLAEPRTDREVISADEPAT